MAIRNISLGGTYDWQDTGSIVLSGNVVTADTVIVVDSTATVKTAGIVKVNSELISYTGKTSGTLTGCTRGAYNTIATSHSDNDTGKEVEILFSTDLNDTFDAAFSTIQGLSAFWLNDELYEVYDDFNSYSTGEMATNTNWTVTKNNAGGGSSTTIVESTNAGGTTKELKITASGSTIGSETGEITLTSNILKANRHTHIKGYISSNAPSGTYYIDVRFSKSGGYYRLTRTYIVDNVLCDIKIICTGDGAYDLYLGGKRVAQYSSISSNNAQIDILVYGQSGNYSVNFYIDDVRQSGSDVY